MKLKKHYAPGPLADWMAMVAAKTAQVQERAAAFGWNWSAHRCRQVALEDAEIEEARQRIPVTHVEVIHTGKAREQTWSSKQVAEWVEHGWAQLEDGTLTLYTAEHQPDLVYAVERTPGYYCRSTGARIPLSDLAMSQFMTKAVATLAPREAAQWLSERGLRPDDYEATRNYHCVLRADLHAQFRVGQEG